MTYQAKSYGKGSKHHQRALKFENDLILELNNLRLIGLVMAAQDLPDSHAFIWKNELPYWKPHSSVCPKLVLTKEAISAPASGEMAAGRYDVDIESPDQHSIILPVHEEAGDEVIFFDTYIHELAHALAPPLTQSEYELHHGHSRTWLACYVRILQRFCWYSREFDRKQAGVLMRELIMKHLKKNHLKKDFPDGVEYKVYK